jgi:hypothetical protein
LSFSISSKSVRQISPRFSFDGLLAAPDIPKPVFTYSEALDWVRANIPVDGREVVAWMQECHSANQILWCFEEEYRRAGSEVKTGSNDAASPGLRVADLSYPAGIPGSTIYSQKYAPVYVKGARVTNCPAPNGKAKVVTRDVFGFAAVGTVYSYQWNGLLAQFTDLAQTPISSRIRVPNVWGMNFYLPFIVSPRLPLPLTTLRMLVSVDRPAKVKLVQHSATDYTVASDFDEVDLPVGQSELTYVLFGFPYVQRFVLSIEPLANEPTVTLDAAETIP